MKTHKASRENYFAIKSKHNQHTNPTNQTEILIDARFEYVTKMDGLKYFQKRK